MNSLLGADRLQQTALLIDADNFSDVRAIEAALRNSRLVQAG